METLLLGQNKRGWEPPVGWSQLPPLPFPLTQHTSAVSGGYLYVLGGRIEDGANSTFIRIKLGDPNWETLLVENTPSPSYRATMLAYQGKLIHYGGWLSDGSLSGDLTIFDTGSKTWASGPSSDPSYSHSAAISEGKMIFTGGFRREGNYAIALESERILDLATTTWLTTRSILTPVGDTGTACNGGPDVWYYGGSSQNSSEALMVRRDDIFVHKNNHQPGRRNHTMTFLNERDIYSFGSYSDIGQSYFERFDVVSEQWDTLEDAPTCRYNHTAHNHEGNLIIVGGTLTGAGMTDEVLVYRP